MIELPEIKSLSIPENNLEIPDDAIFQSEIISEQIQELSKDISEPLKMKHLFLKFWFVQKMALKLLLLKK